MVKDSLGKEGEDGWKQRKESVNIYVLISFFVTYINVSVIKYVSETVLGKYWDKAMSFS